MLTKHAECSVVALTPDQKLGNRLGPKLAQIRIERGYSQEFLAQQLGLHVETISRFERGTVVPTLSRLYELADVLAVPVMALLHSETARTRDVAQEFATSLERLSVDDQVFVRKWFGEICEHLGKSKNPRKKAT